MNEKVSFPSGPDAENQEREPWVHGFDGAATQRPSGSGNNRTENI